MTNKAKHTVGKVLVIGIIVLSTGLALAGMAFAKPAHVNDCKGLYTQAEVNAAVAAAVSAALDGVSSTPESYQMCKMNRRGECIPTRMYMRPLSPR